MTDLDLAIVLHTMMQRLRNVRMFETPPMDHYTADAKARNQCYEAAKRLGIRVTTNVIRVPGDPSMSVLRVRLVEGGQRT